MNLSPITIIKIAINNFKENMQEEIKSLKEAREAYFGALNSVQ